MAALCKPVCFGFGGGRFEDIYGLRFCRGWKCFPKSQILVADRSPNSQKNLDPLIPKRTYRSPIPAKNLDPRIPNNPNL